MLGKEVLLHKRFEGGTRTYPGSEVCDPDSVFLLNKISLLRTLVTHSLRLIPFFILVWGSRDRREVSRLGGSREAYLYLGRTKLRLSHFKIGSRAWILRLEGEISSLPPQYLTVGTSAIHCIDYSLGADNSKFT